MQTLRDTPELLERAIEEMLRVEPPVQAMPRFIREDFTFHGKKLKRNQLALAIIGAANRDPRTFDDPDRFDITRDAPRTWGSVTAFTSVSASPSPASRHASRSDSCSITFPG